MRYLCGALLWIAASLCAAAEHSFHGLADLRYRVADTVPGYLEGGYGKFTVDDGQDPSLAHAALAYQSSFGPGFGAHAVANYYPDRGDSFGISEAYLSYRSLPSSSGLRLDARAGLLYPKVSMENVLTAWTSPYTLDYSTLNAWLAEEVRHQGVEATVTRLGKFHGAQYDLSLGLALLRANDPIGAMVAWHGWVSGSRQSLWNEKLPLPNGELGFVPDASDPFLELDDRPGYHATAEWEWHGRARMLAGHYDNRADPEVFNADLQWSWATHYSHVGVKWQWSENTELIGQYLQGNTLMRSERTGVDLVNNDFHSAFLMLSHQAGPHRLTARLEEYGVDDRDAMAVDDNEEYGRGFTLGYGYRLSRNWFLQAEYTRLQSDRPSRARHDQPVDLRERQAQLALRYFF